MDIATVTTYLKQLAITVLTLIMMLIPSAPDGVDLSYEAENPDALRMSFSAVSDIHVETNNPDAYKAFDSLMRGIKAGQHHDAAVFLGDNVMNGQMLENFLFYSGVRLGKPAAQSLVALGNHDLGNGEGDYEKMRKNFITNNNMYLGNAIENTYYAKVINGCYMIFLASEDMTVNDFVLSEAQFAWLQTQLDEAAAADAPVFVFNHHPLYQISADSNNALTALLNQYNDLLYLHGHMHNDLDEDNFYTYDGIDCISLPRSTEIVDYAPGDGVVVEVYQDEVLVRGRDFIQGKWIDNLVYTYELSR